MRPRRCLQEEPQVNRAQSVLCPTADVGEVRCSMLGPWREAQVFEQEQTANGRKFGSLRFHFCTVVLVVSLLLV